MNIGKNIKERRKAAGLTQKQLADKLNVTASMIGQYETGARSPKIETALHIAKGLGISLADLIGGNDGD